MKRIALVCSEPIRPAMAGIGIRYLEMARRLPAAAGGELSVVLVSPADPEATREALAAAGGGEGVEVRRFERGRLAAVLAGCDAAVAQGQLANDVLLERPALPTADRSLRPLAGGEPPLRRDASASTPTATTTPPGCCRLSRGDFFLCSSEEQRAFYLGFLAALGRVNPERVAADPDLQGLIAPVPFGVPTELPPHRPVLPPRRPGERRLLFGGLYDWYDPWTLLDALERLTVARLDAALHPQPQPRLDAAAPARRGRGALPPARLVGEPGGGARLGPGRPPLRPAARRRPAGGAAPAELGDPPRPCAPASSTPWRPAARW